MKKRLMISAAAALCLACLLFPACQADQKQGLQGEKGETEIEVSGYGRLVLSAPHQFKKLTLFMISREAGEPEKPADYLTLDEGLKLKKVLVTELERAEVGTLVVQNLADKPLFIQAGDVVKGGRQDRTIQTSLVIPPASGPVEVPALCVEHSRWTGGVEFSASEFQAATRKMKIAIQKGEQGAVWDEVADVKEAAVNATGDRQLTSSLNEALYDGKLRALAREYETAFASLPADYPAAIGVACALNGKIALVDIFGSRGLFEKSFPRLLSSFAVEAALDQGITAGPATVTEVRDFIVAMEKGDRREEWYGDNSLVQMENEKGISTGVADGDNNPVHREYVGK